MPELNFNTATVRPVDKSTTPTPHLISFERSACSDLHDLDSAATATALTEHYPRNQDRVGAKRTGTGVRLLIGNVEEWVHPNTNPVSTQDETALTGILAGGGVWLSSDYLSAGYHRTERADFKSPYLGFRVMRAARP